MTDPSPVSELLVRWEQLRAAGQSVPAEELCRDCPELLPEVRRQIVVQEAMLRGLDTGPPPADTATHPQPLPPASGRRPGDEAAPGYTLVKPLGRGGVGAGWEGPPPRGKAGALEILPRARPVRGQGRRGPGPRPPPPPP